MRDHQKVNVEKWQREAESYVSIAESNWATNSPRWGIWGVPDSAIGLLAEDYSGKTCLEIGCGTAYVSAWLSQRGAVVYAIDPTPKQLETAKDLERIHQTGLHLIQGFGESLPIVDASIDFAISEYGAALWADPKRWIPEAARVLKPGAQLVFMTDHLLSFMTTSADDSIGQTRTLLRDSHSNYAMQWSKQDGIEFHLSHGAWIELLRGNGFEIERLIELNAPKNATTRYTWADPVWARRWSAEEIWVVRLT